jgi:hypothetical protein
LQEKRKQNKTTDKANAGTPHRKKLRFANPTTITTNACKKHILIGSDNCSNNTAKPNKKSALTAKTAIAAANLRMHSTIIARCIHSPPIPKHPYSSTFPHSLQEKTSHHPSHRLSQSA